MRPTGARDLQYFYSLIRTTIWGIVVAVCRAAGKTSGALYRTLNEVIPIRGRNQLGRLSQPSAHRSEIVPIEAGGHICDN